MLFPPSALPTADGSVTTPIRAEGREDGSIWRKADVVSAGQSSDPNWLI
jgi:hypothetical protein